MPSFLNKKLHAYFRSKYFFSFFSLSLSLSLFDSRQKQNEDKESLAAAVFFHTFDFRLSFLSALSNPPFCLPLDA
jgi:hypothetical protein